MTTIKIGFDKNRKSIQKELGSIFGEVDILTLFPMEFMTAFTAHNSIIDFIQSAGLDITADETWDSIQDGKMDTYVSKNSEFESWEDMVQTAFHHLSEKQ